MGTQQILLLTLSVIVVAAATAAGIAIFDSQATNQARNAVAMQVAFLGVEAQAWFRTPRILGGGGENPANIANRIEQMARHLDYSATGTVIRNPSGWYTISAGGSVPGGNDETTITIRGRTVRPSGTIEIEGFIDLAGNDRHIIVNVLEMSDERPPNP
jgi:hypothetical protein